MTTTKVIRILAVVLCFWEVTNGQQYTYQSSEFFTGFLKNGNFPTLQHPKLEITTSEDTPVTVRISNVAYEVNITVPPHSVKSIDIPNSLLVESYMETNKGVHIKAADDKKISVYSTNYFITSAGGFPILPLSTYGDDVYVPKYIYYAFSTYTRPTDAANGLESVVLLVAGFDDTEVTITPSQNISIPAVLSTNGQAVTVMAGDTYTIVMNSRQSFLLSSTSDLSSTLIVSNKPLSVISGHECGTVPPNDYCDHMAQQIPPSVTWGRQFMSMPFVGRDTGALFKMISHIHDNSVNVTCTNISSNERTVFSLDLIPGEITNHYISNTEWCSFVSEKPMLIAQYALGGKDDNTGDPLYMLLTPVEQYTNLTLQDVIIANSPFTESHTESQKHVIGIFVSGDVPSGVKVDTNTNVADYTWRPIYNGNEVLGYAVAVEDVDKFNHTVTFSSSESIMGSIVVFGYTKEFNAFGYSVIGELNPISLPWFVTFSQDNYTIVENNRAQIPVMNMDSIHDTLTLSVKMCEGTQSTVSIQFNETITFNPGDSVQYIDILAMDDKNIEPESLCLEIFNPTNPLATVYPTVKANVFIKDDDSTSLYLEQVQLLNSGKDLELTLQIFGYESETDGILFFNATITNSDDGIPQVISPFTVHLTKHITEVKYTLPFQSFYSPSVSNDSIISVTMAKTLLNITLDIDSVHLLIISPPTPTTSLPTTPSKTQTPSPFSDSKTVTSSPPPVNNPTATSSSINPTSSQPPIATEPTFTSVANNNSPSGRIELDLYVVYLIIGLIALLGFVVLLLIIAVAGFYVVFRRNNRHGYDIEKQKKRHLVTQGSSTAELLNSEPRQLQREHRLSSQDSAIFTSSHYSRSYSPPLDDNSVFPTPPSNGSLGFNRTISPSSSNEKEHYDQHVMDTRSSEPETSPKHSSSNGSVAGSKDNLLQSSSV